MPECFVQRKHEKVALSGIFTAWNMAYEEPVVPCGKLHGILPRVLGTLYSCASWVHSKKHLYWGVRFFDHEQ